MTYLVLDVETTTKTSFKRKANPFDPANWTVWVGEHMAGKEPYFEKHQDKESSRDWLARLFERNPGVKVIATMNGKFDILHGIAQSERGLDAWMKFIAEGGQLYDIQLAEYLLRGMTPDSHMMSLDEIAPGYGGKIKPDAVKDLWAAGVDTTDIPDDLMLEYLPGDIENTRLSFLGQIVKAQKVGQQRSIMLNMGALVFTIESERNGMKADREHGLEIAKELEAELAEVTERLNSYVPADLPFPFKWSSRFHKSALLFGGTVSGDVRMPVLDDDGKQVYAQKTEAHYVCSDGTTIAQDVYNSQLMAGASVPTLSYFNSGKNAGSPKTKQVKGDDLTKPKSRIEKVAYTFPRMTEPSKAWASSDPGVWSTASAVIEELGVRDIPFLKDLARQSKLDKDLGTYFIRTDAKSGEQTGMLTLIQPDGLIHHSINMTSTVTGRFSSSNPNMQNLPKAGEGKSRAKEVFISRYPDGCIIQSDFTALEIYVQAIITNCKQMIQDLLDGLDMHVARVATTAGISYEEALRLCKSVLDDGAAEFPEWVDKRTKAKVFSFQRAYGAGAEKISASTGIPIDEVYALINAENLRYPEVEPFYAELGRLIKESKKGVRKVIPHPDFPAKQIALGTGEWRTPDGKLYKWLEQAAPKFVVERQGEWTSFSPTEIKNYPVQGTGAEFAKAGCWLLVKEFYRRRNFNGLAVLINQVHDAAYGDSHPSVRQEAEALIHACMVCASDLMEAYFNWPLPVKVPSDTTSGPNMANEKAIKGIAEAALPYIAEIQERHINQYRKAA